MDDSSSTKRRASRPKVRSGCVTCKNRHVKCDEVKPVCIRCRNAGRECLGYDIPPRKNQAARPSHSVSSLRRRITVYNASAREQRTIEFFWLKTAPQFAFIFNCSLYQGDALQISTSVPAIKYAILATGALHESTLAGGRDEAALKPLKDFALHAYNKAIRCLVEQSANNTAPFHIILSACLLFVCLEFMRGEINTALAHIHSGILMLRQWRAREHSASLAWMSQSTSDEVLFVEKQLMPMTTWLNLFSSRFGRSIEAVWIRPRSEQRDFRVDEITSLDDARKELLDMTSACVELHGRVAEAKYTDSVDDDTVQLKCHLEAALEDWKAKFDDYMVKNPVHPGTTQYVWWIVVMTAYHSLKPNVTESLNPGECTWDHCISDWQAAYDLCEELYAMSLEHADCLSRRFLYEMYIIPYVGLCVRKCRWRILRQQSLELLERCLAHEVFDESFHLYITALRCKVVEEAATPSHLELPPEEVRVHHFLYDAENSTPESHWIMLLYKPDGLAAPWQIIREEIKIKMGEMQMPVTNMKYPGLPQDNDKVQQRKAWEPTLPILLSEERKKTNVLGAARAISVHSDSESTGGSPAGSLSLAGRLSRTMSPEESHSPATMVLIANETS